MDDFLYFTYKSKDFSRILKSKISGFFTYASFNFHVRDVRENFRKYLEFHGQFLIYILTWRLGFSRVDRKFSRKEKKNHEKKKSREKKTLVEKVPITGTSRKTWTLGAGISKPALYVSVTVSGILIAVTGTGGISTKQNWLHFYLYYKLVLSSKRHNYRQLAVRPRCTYISTGSDVPPSGKL